MDRVGIEKEHMYKLLRDDVITELDVVTTSTRSENEELIREIYPVIIFIQSINWNMWGKVNKDLDNQKTLKQEN